MVLRLDDKGIEAAIRHTAEYYMYGVRVWRQDPRTYPHVNGYPPGSDEDDELLATRKLSGDRM
jgi:hypothetical protein